MKNSRFQKAATLLCLCAALICPPAGFAEAEACAAEQMPAACSEAVSILSEEGALDTLEEIPDEPVPGAVVILEEEGALAGTEIIPDEPIPADTAYTAHRTDTMGTADTSDTTAADAEKTAPEALLNDVTILEEEGSLDTLEEIPDEPIPAASRSAAPGEAEPFPAIGIAAAALLLAAAAAAVFFVLRRKKKRFASSNI